MSADLTVPPLPVVAWIDADNTREYLGHSPLTLYEVRGWHPLVRKADADAALASLQARLDAAERSKATLLDALTGAVTRCQRSGYVGQDGQYIKVMRAAIDAATQET
jgi:hypothetical protein